MLVISNFFERDFALVFINPSANIEIWELLFEKRSPRTIIIFESDQRMRGILLRQRFITGGLQNFLILGTKSVDAKIIKVLEKFKNTQIYDFRNKLADISVAERDDISNQFIDNLINPYSLEVRSRTKRIAVLVRQWDALALTEECLSGLQNQTHSNFEIILLDDASNDDSPLELFLRFPYVTLIPLITRAEYCLSFNILAEYAYLKSCDDILIINNDTKNMSYKFLEELQFSLSNKKVGAVSPVIYDYAGKKVHWRKRKWLGIQFNLATECYMLSLENWFSVGGFNNSYFRYCEDLRLCKDFNKIGLSQVLNTTVSLEHMGNGSSRKMLFIPIYYFTRNLIWIQRAYGSPRLDFQSFKKAFAASKKESVHKFNNSPVNTLMSVPLVFIYATLGLLAGILTSERVNDSDGVSTHLIRTNKKLSFYPK